MLLDDANARVERIGSQRRVDDRRDGEPRDVGVVEREIVEAADEGGAAVGRSHQRRDPLLELTLDLVPFGVGEDE